MVTAWDPIRSKVLLAWSRHEPSHVDNTSVMWQMWGELVQNTSVTTVAWGEPSSVDRVLVRLHRNFII